MYKFIFIFSLLLFSFSQFSLADEASNWGIAKNSEMQKHQKEVSEFIWDAEMQTYIENEYGSQDSGYYNNRGADYSNGIGGDAFNNSGY